MTIKEAITRFEQFGEISLDKSECKYVEVSLLNEWKEEQKQVAAWLKELVEFRSKEDIYTSSNPTVEQATRINRYTDDALIQEYYRVERLIKEDDRFNPMSYAKYSELVKYFGLIKDAINFRKIILY